MSFVTGVVGCTSKVPASAEKLNVYPVSGKLTVKGQPKKGLVLLLRPKQPFADSVTMPTATVGADGSFKVRTYANEDGAPAGAYSLVVNIGSAGAGNDPQKIKKLTSLLSEHASVASPAAEIVVKEGNNSLDPIDLK